MVNDIKQNIVVEVIARVMENTFKNAENIIDRTIHGTTMLSARAKEVGTQFTALSNITGKFNWRLLSTLFLGMQISRTFGNMLQPAMEVAGIFEIIGLILEILFLPFALLLLDPLLGIMEFFINLPEPIQLVIGVIFALIYVFGQILFWFSQLGLGAGAVVNLIFGFFGWLLGVIGTILSGIVTLVGGWGVGMVAAVAIVLASILFNITGWIDAIVSYATNFATAFSNIFTGMFSIVSGIIQVSLGVILGLFTGDFKRIEDGINSFSEGAKKLFTGLFEFIYNITVGGLLLFGKAFSDGLSNAFKFATDIILGFMPELDGLFSILKSIWELITGIGGGIGKAVSGGYDFIKSFNIPGFAEGGIVLGPTLATIGEKGPEAIIPLTGKNSPIGGQNIFAPSIIIENPVVRNDMDIREIADQVNRILVDDYNRSV